VLRETRITNPLLVDTTQHTHTTSARLTVHWSERATSRLYDGLHFEYHQSSIVPPCCTTCAMTACVFVPHQSQNSARWCPERCCLDGFVDVLTKQTIYYYMIDMIRMGGYPLNGRFCPCACLLAGGCRAWRLLARRRRRRNHSQGF